MTDGTHPAHGSGTAGPRRAPTGRETSGVRGVGAARAVRVIGIETARDRPRPPPHRIGLRPGPVPGALKVQSGNGPPIWPIRRTAPGPDL